MYKDKTQTIHNSTDGCLPNFIDNILVINLRNQTQLEKRFWS